MDSAAWLFPVPVSPFEEHGDVRRRGALHQGEAHPRGHRAADERAEVRVLRQLELGLLSGQLEAQAHASQLQQAAVADRGLLHHHAVEHGAVPAAQVLGPDALVVHQELAVEAGHGALVEQHVVERVAPDGGSLAGRLEALSGSGTVDHPESETADIRHQARSADPEGRCGVRVAFRRGGRGGRLTSHLVRNFPLSVAYRHPHGEPTWTPLTRRRRDRWRNARSRSCGGGRDAGTPRAE
jgi:hypothetical protein